MKTFIIIGLTPQGLSMLRLLARAGFKVIAFTNAKKAVGYHSRYGEKHVFSTVEELKNLINQIVQNQEEKINCIITSGELLSLILANFPELYEMCTVQSGPYPLIKMLSDKTLMYNYAETKGLKCAKHTLLNQYKTGDLKFPIILKRNIEVPLFFKTKKIFSEEELNSFMTRIESNKHQHILIQEFITIKKPKDISIQAYLYHGTIKACFVCYQERRLSIGITSYLKEMEDDSMVKMITEKTKTFFEGTKYTGFCEIEFMYDPDYQKLYFIEVNTRTCGLHSVLGKKFHNLPELYLNIDNPPALVSSSRPISWINIARDIKARIQNKDFKNLSQFFTSEYDILDLRDWKPFLFQFIRL